MTEAPQGPRAPAASAAGACSASPSEPARRASRSALGRAPSPVWLSAASSAEEAASVHPFFGAHQAGITTPVQDRLHFASFDMMARTDRADLVALLQDWTYAAARMTQGLEVSATGAVGGSPEAPPDDTGEAMGLPASNLTITFGFGPTLFELDGVDRYGIAAQRPASLERLPRFPRRRPGSCCVRRRPVHPGMRRRSAGRGARHPQSQPHRVRPRTPALVAARLRPHVAHDVGSADAAQPLRVQGRHAQHPRGRQRGARRARVGLGIRFTGVDGGWLVPRRPQDRDAHRDVGSRAALRAERHHRPHQGRGRPAVGRHRVHRARLRRDAAPRVRRRSPSTATCASRIRTRTAAPGCCVAATTSSTATTTSAASTPGSSSSRISAAPSSSSRCSARSSTDIMSEYIRHVRSGLWAIPPGRSARFVRRARGSSPRRGQTSRRTSGCRRRRAREPPAPRSGRRARTGSSARCSRCRARRRP